MMSQSLILYIKLLCTEAAFAASLPHSSGPFFDLDFAFGVFSGESFSAVRTFTAEDLLNGEMRKAG